MRTITLFFTLLLLFVQCGPSTEERARQLQRQTDSIDAVTERMFAEMMDEPKQPEQSGNSEAEIKKKLKKIAARDWPDDYTTQEYWINKQMKDYRYMLTVPDNSIKRRAQKDWPLDFSTQRYWYNKQMEAKNRLNK